MTTVLWLLGAAGGCWLIIIAFNVVTTAVIRRLYGYSWDQVKTHVILRSRITKNGHWDRRLGPLLARYIKTLTEDELLLAGSIMTNEFAHRATRFIELMGGRGVSADEPPAV